MKTASMVRFKVGLIIIILLMHNGCTRVFIVEGAQAYPKYELALLKCSPGVYARVSTTDEKVLKSKLTSGMLENTQYFAVKDNYNGDAACLGTIEEVYILPGTYKLLVGFRAGRKHAKEAIKLPFTALPGYVYLVESGISSTRLFLVGPGNYWAPYIKDITGAE